MQSKNSSLKNVLYLLSPHKYRIAFVCLCMIIGAAANVAIPLANTKMIDQGIIALNFKAVVSLNGIVVGLFILVRILDFFEFKQLVHIRKQVEVDLLLTAQNHLLHLPISYFKDNNEAQIMSNLNYDLSKISKITDKAMFMSVAQIFYMVGGIVGLCVVDTHLLVLVVLIVPIKILTTRYFAKKRESLFSALMPLLSKLGSWWATLLVMSK